MTQIDPKDFEFAIERIEDGFVFESFAQSSLAALNGWEFIPVGGSGDKGIDGYQHTFSKKGSERTIVQMSTEKDAVGKIRSSLEKLRRNKKECDRFIYVTNRKVNNSDNIIDEMYTAFQVHVSIHDLNWFTIRCNENQGVIAAYSVFVDRNLHQYSKPGYNVTVANLDKDSRLYVFLSQRLNYDRKNSTVDNLICDTLIMYALEGTDPDKDVFLTDAEIKKKIKSHVTFDSKLIEGKVSQRLVELAKKPRKIQFHPDKLGFCLPFETRFEIEQRNLGDERLYNEFYKQTEKTVKKYFDAEQIQVYKIEKLISKVLVDIFKKQGLEFSNFVVNQDSNAVVEQSLKEVIATSVEASSVKPSNWAVVKTALHLAIRDIVYHGTAEQRQFLKSLSNTYLMMFMLRWEPKLTTYFESMSSKLRIFVDNSIIIPALSEFFLPEGNRRHWNLLKGAKRAGIEMFINETLMDELVSHFRMVKNKYKKSFEGMEDFYVSDDSEFLFVDEILIRAYFYSKRKGKAKNFNDFINYFLDPSLKNAKADLITYIQDEFGIKYISNESWDIKVNADEKNKLVEVLKVKKKDEQKAINDSEMILAIYYLREKNNEASEGGIFGYSTWWLSKDTSTYRAVQEALDKDKYRVGCYIRPDFVYNYIALMPSSTEVNEAYDMIFPTMLGVNLSYHMPKEISKIVHEKVKAFHDQPPVRVRQILKTLGERLKSDPALLDKKALEHFFDEERAALQRLVN